jgi:4-hydroxy-2-oxoheptanedioate aldolase
LIIKGAEGLRNCEEIANVPGVDWLLEGAVDLSQSLGVAGDPFHPSVLACVAFNPLCLTCTCALPIAGMSDAVAKGLSAKAGERFAYDA